MTPIGQENSVNSNDSASNRTHESPRHARVLRNRSGVKVTALIALASVTFAGAGVAFAGYRLQNNITIAQDISSLLMTPTGSNESQAADVSDSFADQPLNILVIGSDAREGGIDESGQKVSGMRSDTTLIAHISGDRSRIQLVSIARDVLVDIPACHLDHEADGPTTKPRPHTRFNEAFSLDGKSLDVSLGAACAMNTITAATNIQFSDFVIVDFAGFRSMVDAVGGVPIHLDSPMISRQGELYVNFPAGDLILDGEDALNFVRARKLIGTDNSDTQRIGRQQIFLGALTRTVLSAGTLTNPAAVGKFLSAATSSMTVSPGLGGTALPGLVWSLRSAEPANVQFVSVPWTDSGDGATVVWTSAAQTIWDAILLDLPAPATIDANGVAPASSEGDPSTE